MVWVIGRIRSNWFGYQLGNRVNWFGLEQNWFGIGLDKSNLPHQCKPNANVWPSLPPDERPDLGIIQVTFATAGTNGFEHGLKDLASGSHSTLRQQALQRREANLARGTVVNKTFQPQGSRYFRLRLRACPRNHGRGLNTASKLLFACFQEI